MGQETIFHKILSGDIPADVVYEDDDVLAFKDIHPKAPTHLLFIAKKEEDFLSSIVDMTAENKHVPQLLIEKAQAFAKEKGIRGYKLVFHCGKEGGQEVFFLHLHFMSQQQLESA